MIDSEEKIIAALQRAETELDDKPEETLGQVWSDMVRSQSWFLLIWPWLGMVVMMGVAVFAAVQFFGATAVRDVTMYATLFLFAMISIAMLKIWFWLRWVRNSTLREIKRMELRLLTVAGKQEHPS